MKKKLVMVAAVLAGVLVIPATASAMHVTYTHDGQKVSIYNEQTADFLAVAAANLSDGGHSFYRSGVPSSSR